ncbi:DUF2510 domain-containing protein [Rhodococcus sp. 077-4]|uniref:DUF2510 domain-containing protein n=1 Tax=Rhodococcus sp. 077-4 TaxID=2789271 RepID=UPI0039F639D7
MATSPWHFLIVLVLLVIPVAIIGAVVYAVLASNRRRSPAGTTLAHTAAPGWYPDPGNPRQFRWFDGMQWTDLVGPTGPVPPPTQ